VSHSVESGSGGKDQSRCQYAAVRDEASHPVLDRVSEVDDRGQVIRVYGGIRGCGPKQFSWPSHMALAPLSCGPAGDASGADDFSLLVVDKNNCRVIVLDAELRFEHVLLNKELDRLLANPWRLSYSSTTGRLVVGLENGIVCAYGETIDHRRRRLSRSRELLE
jgi:hypothetical protein